MTTREYGTCENCGESIQRGDERWPLEWHSISSNPAEHYLNVCAKSRHGHDPKEYTRESAIAAALDVEQGRAPSGSVIFKLTGPNSLSSPGS